MSYGHIDNEELLRLALDALRSGRDADAMEMVKTLLERDPGHVYAHYLLAAQHAELGLVDRAEVGFRAAMTLAPEFAIARFQLGQLLLVTGRSNEAQVVFAPLLQDASALGAYTRALTAAAADDREGAIREAHAGLALPQHIPALAEDMKRLLVQWQRAREAGASPGPSPAAAPMFLANYDRGG
jgi:predicted Zn-dependent protease